jgi:hypothetical protein
VAHPNGVETSSRHVNSEELFFYQSLANDLEGTSLNPAKITSRNCSYECDRTAHNSVFIVRAMKQKIQHCKNCKMWLESTFLLSLTADKSYLFNRVNLLIMSMCSRDGK